MTLVTPDTVASLACSPVSRGVSAAVSGPPSLVAADNRDRHLSAVPNGAARTAACELGALGWQELLVVALGDARQAGQLR